MKPKYSTDIQKAQEKITQAYVGFYKNPSLVQEWAEHKFTTGGGGHETTCQG